MPTTPEHQIFAATQGDKGSPAIVSMSINVTDGRLGVQADQRPPAAKAQTLEGVPFALGEQDSRAAKQQ
jgi:hypothetical protein